MSVLIIFGGILEGKASVHPVKTTKTIYDPCPAGYKILPGDVFLSLHVQLNQVSIRMR